MVNKTIIITGANKGLGKETCRQLAGMGYHIIMVCRDEQRGEQARTEIINTTGNERIDLLTADFASLQDIYTLSAVVHEKYDHVDVLINNAGIFVTDFQFTRDGHELQWQVNYLSSYLFTVLLLDVLAKAPQARIITVSSIANYKGNIHFEDLNLEQSYNGLVAYRQSKLANVLFTFELAQRLKVKNITANCLHPGLVRTTIGHHNNSHWKGWAWLLLKPLMNSIEKGAFCSVKLATDPTLSETSGNYFDDDGSQKPPNPLVFDTNLRKQLWELSAKLVGIDHNKINVFID